MGAVINRTLWESGWGKGSRVRGGVSEGGRSGRSPEESRRSHEKASMFRLNSQDSSFEKRYGPFSGTKEL